MAGTQKVVIIGGGFAGIRTALELAKKRDSLEITLISDRANFEYYPALFHVVLGGDPSSVSIPLKDIFAGKPVKLVLEAVSGVDVTNKKVSGQDGHEFTYDFLVIALGSETGYFGLPGLPELSYGFKSVVEATKLRQHIHEVLTPVGEMTPDQKTIAGHFVIVGGGPTGIELAGELNHYARMVAKKHGFDASAITVDLIEALPRLLPILPEDVSAEMRQQLAINQVNVYLNRMVTGQEPDMLTLKDMTLRSKTVIWTAGMKPNRLIAQIQGLELEKRGRIVVDEYMQAKNFAGVFVVGDNAPSQYSGMAQTADHDGYYVATAISCLAKGGKLTAYVAKKPVYAIPAGFEWGMVLWGNTRMYGWLGYALRRLADLRYLMSVVPFSRALGMVKERKLQKETCPICKK